jgi:hypothetical protein
MIQIRSQGQPKIILGLASVVLPTKFSSTSYRPTMIGLPKLQTGTEPLPSITDSAVYRDFGMVSAPKSVTTLTRNNKIGREMGK